MDRWRIGVFSRHRCAPGATRHRPGGKVSGNFCQSVAGETTMEAISSARRSPATGEYHARPEQGGIAPEFATSGTPATRMVHYHGTMVAWLSSGPNSHQSRSPSPPLRILRPAFGACNSCATTSHRTALLRGFSTRARRPACSAVAGGSSLGAGRG